MPSTSIFAQVIDKTVLPSTIDPWVGGTEGGGRIKQLKPHLEVIICIFEPWTETLRCSNIIQEQAPTARQKSDASPPPLYKDRSMNPPLPRPLKVCESVGQEAIPS